MWVLDDVCDENLLRDVAGGVPAADWPHWVRYENDCERKRTTRDIHRLNDATCRLFAWLASTEWVRRLESLTGVTGLMPDPTLHGGGIHVCDAGGKLAPHLDYALHPHLNLERRVNVILFLSPEWREAWGGRLQFWNDAATEVTEAILPQFGRAVVWENSDVAFHSTERVDSPVPRITAAGYYLTLPRPTATRKRALFVPDRSPR